MYVAVCCSVLYCVQKFTMTGTRSSSGVIPQVCVLRCVALCENVVDDWKSIFAWDYATVMCVALCCGVLRCCAICENVCDVCDGSFRLKVSFAKEPYNRDYILQKRPMIWRNLLIVATPYPIEYVKIWIYIYIYVWIYAHVYVNKCVHECIYICIYIYIYIYTCTLIYVWICVCVNKYVFIHIYINRRNQRCFCTNIYV